MTRRLAPLTALLLVGALAGCGGSQTTTQTTTETTASPAATTSTSASSPAETTTAGSTSTDTATSGTTTDAATTGSSTTATSPGSGSYTMAEVGQHSSRESCWTAIQGNVYDVTPWIDQHPGGPDRILGLCGKDGSSMFEGQHQGESEPNSRLDAFKIGTLKN